MSTKWYFIRSQTPYIFVQVLFSESPVLFFFLWNKQHVTITEPPFVLRSDHQNDHHVVFMYMLLSHYQCYGNLIGTTYTAKRTLRSILQSLLWQTSLLHILWNMHINDYALFTWSTILTTPLPKTIRRASMFWFPFQYYLSSQCHFKTIVKQSKAGVIDRGHWQVEQNSNQFE